MHIQILQTDDADVLNGLLARIMPSDTIDFNKNVCWVAYVDDTPAGFCTVKRLDRENSVFLSLAGVLHKYRGAGLQRQMIKARLRWAKRNGYECALTYTLKDNYPSISNLIKCGFRFYNPYNRWVGDVFYFKRML